MPVLGFAILTAVAAMPSPDASKKGADTPEAAAKALIAAAAKGDRAGLLAVLDDDAGKVLSAFLVYIDAMKRFDEALERKFGAVPRRPFSAASEIVGMYYGGEFVSAVEKPDGMVEVRIRRTTKRPDGMTDICTSRVPAVKTPNGWKLYFPVVGVRAGSVVKEEDAEGNLRYELDYTDRAVWQKSTAEMMKGFDPANKAVADILSKVEAGQYKSRAEAQAALTNAMQK